MVRMQLQLLLAIVLAALAVGGADAAGERTLSGHAGYARVSLALEEEALERRGSLLGSSAPMRRSSG